MALESALVKPVVDAIMALLRRGENMQLNRNAEKAVREAIRELLLASPDENKAAARIAVAKAAGLLSEDVVLAEEMLQKHRATKSRTYGKASTGRRQGTAKAPAKAMARKKPTPSKTRPASSASKAKPAAEPGKAAPAKTAKAAAKKRTAARKKTTARTTGSHRRSDDTD